MNRESILSAIREERERHSSLYGAEFDLKNGVNDWSAIASGYVLQEIRRKGVKPETASWRDSMIKAAAVLVAALEHEEHLKDQKEFDE